MYKIKYVGTGIVSMGRKFKPEINDGLYTVTKTEWEYFNKTFPQDFILIERIVKENIDKKENVKNNTKPIKKKRNKKDSIIKKVTE